MIFNFDWNVFLPLLKQFGLIVLGLTVYCVFVFSFYRRVSRTLIFEFKPVGEKKGFRAFLVHASYVAKYLFLGPLYLFVWASLLALLIFLMADSLAVLQCLYVSLGLLATIRITSYYNQDLSVDVAKIMPFSLLAVVLIDINKIRFDIFIEKLKEVPTIWQTAVMMFAVIVFLELLLRMYHALANRA